MCGEGSLAFVVVVFIIIGVSVAPALPGISSGVRTPGHKVGGVGEVESQDSQTVARMEGITSVQG